jgi:hypothetical protein
MISHDSDAATATIVLNPASCAATANATSGWIDVRAFKGTIAVVAQIGAVTGSITGKLRSATDSGGTGAADITGATFTAVSAANKIQKITIPATTAPYIQYVGTIVTGPALVAVSCYGHPGSV